MGAKYSQSIGAQVFIALITLNMLPSYAQADAETSAATAPAVEFIKLDEKELAKLVEQASTAYDHQDLEASIRLYTQAAKQNYIPAQVILGVFFDSAQEFETAVGWYLMAAMQGDAEGQYHLAKMYQLGNGIEKDPAKASYWYRRSAAKNYIPALRALAISYADGSLGTKIDLEQSRAWNAKAERLQLEANKVEQAKIEKLAADMKKLREEEAKKNK